MSDKYIYKPEPVLRWEGEDLVLGEVSVGLAWSSEFSGRIKWRSLLESNKWGFAPTLTEARTAAETAVREWLQRAGCV